MQEYSFIDIAPAEGNNYYRIAAVSSNGEIQYSNIAVVDHKQGSTLTSTIYPTVSSNEISVLFQCHGNENVNIMVANMDGKALFYKKLMVHNNYVYPLNISALPAGNYVVKIDWQGKFRAHMFIKQ